MGEKMYDPMPNEKSRFRRRPPILEQNLRQSFFAVEWPQRARYAALLAMVRVP
jgi:hypothetical protein